jgi:hypothetical protein
MPVLSMHLPPSQRPCMTADKTALLRLCDVGKSLLTVADCRMTSGEVLGKPALQLHPQQRVPE